ncbi:MAG: hypothetical protein AABM66_13760 [Actinomycetota bacterium]
MLREFGVTPRGMTADEFAEVEARAILEAQFEMPSRRPKRGTG